MKAITAVALALSLAAPIVQAHDHKTHGMAVTQGPITVADAYARAAAASGGASAAYMTITIAEGSDRLIAAASPAAARVELHTHQMDANGVARMRKVPAIDVTADAPATLEPGGLHVMLMGLTAPLEEGASIDLTLTFEAAGDLSLTVPVRAVSSGMMRHN
jgi:copper(I)-binding protein